MQNKQEVNGKKGETRTENILLDYFILHKIIPDIEGRDFMAELPFNNLKTKEKNPIYAIIQAKFFEGNNEVKIRKEFVEDETGVKTEFFAFLHTDDEDYNEVCYFFSASEIRDNFRIRADANTNIEYYIFSLTRERQFEKFKNIPKSEINRRIEEGIRQTDKYKNQQNIQKIKEGFINPIKSIYNTSNQELFKCIKNKHIVDKLYTALNEFKDFRRITAWRLIDKISFKESHQTSTTYNLFSLTTNNPEILDFFDNIEIEKEVTIKNRLFFKGIKDYKLKVNRIIDLLNENGIFNLTSLKKNKTVSIKKTLDESCNCLKCNYYRLNFSKVYLILGNNTNITDDYWFNMQHAYLFFMLGDYENAQKIYSSIAEKAKQNKKSIIYFFAKYNLRVTALHNWESEYPDLSIELGQLNISDDKRSILNSISDNTLSNDYSKVIDEVYLKIKDYKQRRVVNDTADLINRLYVKLFEYLNFIEGNWLLINSSDEFHLMVEKVIESCIISYSMKTDYTYHLNSLNDFLVQMAIHHCEPDKLLSYFQRNDVRKINYKSDCDYFKNCLDNFFSKENINFLYLEIVYFDGRTKNPDLRRTIGKTFENLCILLAYLDINVKSEELLKDISYFIDKLDFSIHDASILAHPMLSKPELFKIEDLLHLIKAINLKKNYSEGYLLTNCLYCLKEKGFIFTSSDENIVNSIIGASLKYPGYGLLNVLPNLLSTVKLRELKNDILKSLDLTFSPELYYESVITRCLENPVLFFDSYLEFIGSIMKKEQMPDLFRTSSPYTGVHGSLREDLNNLVEVLYIINDNSLRDKPQVKNVEEYHPYYKFLLNIDAYKVNDSFNLL